MSELNYQVDLLKAMNQRLGARERTYRFICDASRCAYLYYSFEKNEYSMIGKWEDFFSFEIHGTKDLEKLFDEVEEQFRVQLRETLFPEKAGKDEDELECLRGGGRQWLSFYTHVAFGLEGAPTDKLITVCDVTKEKLQRDELIYMAHYDGITGLYNRNYFVSLLSKFVRKAEADKSVISVMIIDIDDFKKVNDGFGMLAGDELIQEFGAFLKQFNDGRMIASHLSNDVYCVAIYEPSGTYTVEHIWKEIRRRTREPFVLTGGQSVSITVSVGVAEYPEAAESALDLINTAEIIMFHCKQTGNRGSIQYFNTEIRNEFLRNAELENKLKKAVLDLSFELYYQPQFYAGNRRLRGMEALIRWKDVNGKFISPAQFIPVAERIGCIVAIGDWVLEESIRQYSVWRDRYGIPFTLSINISSIQFKMSHFTDHLLALLQQYHVEPREIELEITESILIDHFEEVYRKLRILKEKGLRISLDDFGTGYSSLSYLRILPFDTLKIDKSFIDTVLSDSTTRIITESIIDLVKALGFESIAEGVEHEDQLDYLHSIGCDVIQGYFLSKPIPVEDVEKLLSEIA